MEAAPPAIAVVPAADAYALRCEQLRAEISALSNVNKGQRHTVPVVALFVTSTPPAAGDLEITATWTAPVTDPALGASLLYGGLMAIRHQAPGVYALLLERLRADGALTPP
jgi:hypothetical protein